MDFARKQLEKYGWSDGKGLGRHENGIAEPLKPRLKRSAAGLGHDAAAELNDHWWSTLYDQAASNIKVKNKTKISTRDPDAFAIGASTWRIRSKPKRPSGELDGFVKTAVLTSGGAKTLRLHAESDSEEEITGTGVTDEELFAACGGRTAHKGARHGLRATGKLARIEEQEKILLKQAKYRGYSQALEDGVSRIEEDESDANIECSENIKHKHKNKNDIGNVKKTKKLKSIEIKADETDQCHEEGENSEVKLNTKAYIISSDKVKKKKQSKPIDIETNKCEKSNYKKYSSSSDTVKKKKNTKTVEIETNNIHQFLKEGVNSEIKSEKKKDSISSDNVKKQKKSKPVEFER